MKAEPAAAAFVAGSVLDHAPSVGIEREEQC